MLDLALVLIGGLGATGGQLVLVRLRLLALRLRLARVTPPVLGLHTHGTKREISLDLDLPPGRWQLATTKAPGEWNAFRTQNKERVSRTQD